MRRTDIAQAGAHPVDRHVGQAVRLRRKLLGVSQQALAQRLGLTFQQVQKYETGANRISASALHGIAQALEVPVSAFFDGLPTGSARDGEGVDDDAMGERGLVTRMLTAPGGVTLAAAWLDLPPGPLRHRLARLAEAMAQKEEEKEEEKEPQGGGRAAVA
jgi:transcriptional regulator with XRE-family HTH domain